MKEATQGRGKLRTGHETPWGTAQTVVELAPGIEAVTTASHGGIHLDAEHAAKVSSSIVDKTWLGLAQWFEEDCDWCIPFVLFESEILEHGSDHHRGVIARGIHRASFTRHHGQHEELLNRN